MRIITHRIAIAVVLFGLADAAAITAQNMDEEKRWLEETPCYKPTEIRSSTKLIGSGKFKICFDYNPLELTPGPNQSPRKTPLTISIYTKAGQENAKIGILTIPDLSENPGLIVTPISGPETPPDLRYSTANVYTYDLTIDGHVKPHPYRLKMLLAYHTMQAEEYFDLPVSVSGMGLLDVGKNSPATLSYWTGEQHNLKLEVINNSTYYPMTIYQVNVDSDPDGLVTGETLTKEQTVGTDGAPEDLVVPFTTKGMNPLQVLFGFGKSPKLKVSVDYKDSFGRPYRLPLAFDLDLKPQPFYLIMALLIGALLGMVLRIDLYRLEKGGFISRKQKFYFAAGAASTGIIISIIAIAANLKLVMFGDQSGYSSFDPRLLLLIALVGTMGGVALLNPLLPLAKRQAKSEAEPAEDEPAESEAAEAETAAKGDEP